MLVTKGGAELEDGTTYRLAFPTGSISGYEDAEEVLSITPQTALADYTASLGEFGAADILWN